MTTNATQESACRGYDWGVLPGIEGQVLVCRTHGWAAQGEAYEELDRIRRPERLTTPCQAEEY